MLQFARDHPVHFPTRMLFSMQCAGKSGTLSGTQAAQHLTSISVVPRWPQACSHLAHHRRPQVQERLRRGPCGVLHTMPMRLIA